MYLAWIALIPRTSHFWATSPFYGSDHTLRSVFLAVLLVVALVLVIDPYFELLIAKLC